MAFFLGALAGAAGYWMLSRRRMRTQPVVYTYTLQACRLCGCRNVRPQEAASMGLAPSLPVEALYPPTVQRRPFGYRQPYGYYDGYIPAYTYRGRRIRPFY